MSKQLNYRYCCECIRYDFCNEQSVIEINPYPACKDFKGVYKMLIEEILRVLSPEQAIQVYDLNGDKFDGFANECNLINLEVIDIWFSKINNRLMIEVR